MSKLNLSSILAIIAIPALILCMFEYAIIQKKLKYIHLQSEIINTQEEIIGIQESIISSQGNTIKIQEELLPRDIFIKKERFFIENI